MLLLFLQTQLTLKKLFSEKVKLLLLSKQKIFQIFAQCCCSGVALVPPLCCSATTGQNLRGCHAAGGLTRSNVTLNLSDLKSI